MHYPTQLSEYVREMNNQIFLSEHQLNGLYIMLLLRPSTNWDNIIPTEQFKQGTSALLDLKIKEVDVNLNLLLRAYEEKIKSSQINRIQKFMSIFKARNKSMYIHIRKNPIHCLHSEQHEHNLQENGDNSKQEDKQNDKQKQGDSGDQLMGVFYGISNINALSGGLGSDSIVDFNTSQRYITFKMGKRYNLTVKNDDEVFRDTTSSLSRIPKELFVYHILPYFGAQQLFGLRSVCKQWQTYVKDAWHSCFKREMYTQLLASQLCKEIEYHYKLIQLRNPFYQKMILLLHALVQLMQWQQLFQSVDNNTIPFSLKKIILVLLLLLGHKLPVLNINEITDAVWNDHVHLVKNLKQNISSYFENLANSVLSINDLKLIKANFFDNPFFRIDEIVGDDKTPLLLYIFAKQFLLQSIIKNHIMLGQQYLCHAKDKLDKISKGWPSNQRFLQGAYKVLLLRGRESEGSGEIISENDRNQPDFAALLKSVLENSTQQFQTPDFTIKAKNTITNIYLDKRTKWDIILSTLKKTGALDKEEQKQGQQGQQAHQEETSNKEQAINQETQSNQQTNDVQKMVSPIQKLKAQQNLTNNLQEQKTTAQQSTQQTFEEREQKEGQIPSHDA